MKKEMINKKIDDRKISLLNDVFKFKNTLTKLLLALMNISVNLIQILFVLMRDFFEKIKA